MTRPSVGLFTYSTLPRGSVVHTAYLAEALQAAGWDATVYALDKDRRGFFRALRAELRLVPAGPAPPTTAALVRQRAAELVDFLGRENVRHDVYHAQDCLTANALLDGLAGGASGSGHAPVAPVARTVHHVEAFEDPYLARCQERSICDAGLCFAVSDAARQDVLYSFGVRARRVTNGVSFERFSRVDPERVATLGRELGDSAGPVLLAVGGVEPRKNTVRVLRAFVRIRGRQPLARLWIVGGATVLDHGAYRSDFDRALAALPPATRAAVTELGVVADEDVPVLFQLASVLTLPSTHEGFGLAALEALAAGLPVVASDRAPFTEFLDSSCATLVDPRSEAAIADGILQALCDSSERRDRGRRRALTFSWQRVAAMHVEGYRSLIAERSGGEGLAASP